MADTKPDFDEGSSFSATLDLLLKGVTANSLYGLGTLGAGAAGAAVAGPQILLVGLVSIVGLTLLRLTGRKAQNPTSSRLYTLTNLALAAAEANGIRLEDIKDESFISHFDSQMDRKKMMRALAKIWRTTQKDHRTLETALEKLQKNTKLIGELQDVFGKKLDGIDQLMVNVQDFRLDLDDQLAELGKNIKAEINQGTSSVLQQIKARFEQMAKEHRGWPDLVIPHLDLPKDQSSANVHLFAYQYIDYVGRETEREALRRFSGPLDGSSPKLAWWLMLGPGGSGKSRTALELCLEAKEQGWDAGFLLKSQDLDSWRQWRPAGPALIVVDYVDERAQSIAERIEELYNRRNQLSYPVRFLLLSREKDTDWWKRDFIPSGSIRRERLHACVCGGDPEKSLELQPLEEEIQEIVRKVLAKRGVSGVSIDTKVLRRITEGRPLLAIYVAEALAESGQIKQLNVKDIVEYVLKREERLWKQHQANDPKHLNLLLLATLMSGILPREFQNVFGQTQWTDLLPNTANCVDLNIYQVLCGSRSSAERGLPPLEPDILGELYVLEQFSTESLDPPIVKLREAAWKIDPRGSAVFVQRTAMDFPDHANLLELAKLPSIADSGVREVWAMLVVNMVGVLGDRRLLPKAVHMFDALKSMAEFHLDEPALRECQARAANNLTYDFGWAGKLEKAEEYYRVIEGLTRAHPDESALREPQATAAYNLALHTSSTGNMEKAEKYYGVIEALAKAHTDESALWDLQGKAATNLTAHFGTADKLEKAEEYYQIIEGLTQTHPDDPSLREEQAKAATNLTAHFGTADKLEKAEEYYRIIERLAAAHSNEVALRETQASAANNLVYHFARTGRLDEAERYYRIVEGLIQDHPDDAALRTVQAKAATNLTASFGEARQWKQAEEYYRIVARLAGAHSDEVALREWQAKAAFNLTADFGETGKPEKAEKYYQIIKQLVGNTSFGPSGSDILFRATAAMCFANLNAKHLGTAKQWFEKVKGLAEPGGTSGKQQNILEMLQAGLRQAEEENEGDSQSLAE